MHPADASDTGSVGGSVGGSGTGSAGGGAGASDEQERIIAEHEAVHGPMPKRILAELRSRTQQAGGVAGEAGSVAAKAGGVAAKAGGAVGEAAEALRLEIVETKLEGPRALVGHVLGMRLLIPAEGVHGPRETAALLYLFADAIAIRPTDDAPMSAVPLYGLHIVMPHVAVARWMYKAGRTAHANIDLAKDERGVEASLAEWTVDDFRQADDKLQVFMRSDIQGQVHLYEALGLVHLALQPAAGRMVRLKSSLPEPQSAYQHLWNVFAEVVGPAGLTVDKPPKEHDQPSA